MTILHHFFDSDRQKIDLELTLELMPKLKEAYLQDHPCKLEEDTIQILKVTSAQIEDCHPLIEKSSFAYTPLF